MKPESKRRSDEWPVIADIGCSWHYFATLSAADEADAAANDLLVLDSLFARLDDPATEVSQEEISDLKASGFRFRKPIRVLIEKRKERYRIVAYDLNLAAEGDTLDAARAKLEETILSAYKKASTNRANKGLPQPILCLMDTVEPAS